MNTKRYGSYLCVVSICGLLGCAGDDVAPTLPSEDAEPAPAENAPAWKGGAASKLVAEAKLSSSKRTVRFFEPTPGTLVELEMGPLEESQEAEPPGLDSVRRYEYLTGRPAPEALRAAQWRANIVAKEGAEPDQPPTIERPTIESSGAHDKATRLRAVAESEQWFLNNYCVATDRNQLWLNISSWSYFDGSGVNMMRVGIYTITGNVFFELLYAPNGVTANQSFTGTLPAGWFAGFRSASTRDAYVLSHVVDAEGDRYHHCINYHY